MLRVADDSDNSKRTSFRLGSEAKVPAHRILFQKELFCHGLIDDRNSRSGWSVTLRKAAAAQDRHAKSLEIVRPHGMNEHFLAILGLRTIVDGYGFNKCATTEGTHRGEGCGLYSRNSVCTLHNPFIDLEKLSWITVYLIRGNAGNVEQPQVFRVETEIDPSQIHNRVDEKSRARQQHQ